MADVTTILLLVTAYSKLIPFFIIFISCSTCGDKGGRPVAYIASTIRNPPTYELFLNKLCKYGLLSQTLFPIDANINIIIINLFFFFYIFK